MPRPKDTTSFEDRPADLSRMTLPQLIDLVGRKPRAVEVLGKWVVCTFAGMPTALANGHTQLGADIIVRFKQW